MDILKRRNQGRHGFKGWHRVRVSMIFAMVLTLAMGFFTALPVMADDCPDDDGDGYVVCNGCDLPAGKTCGDCDDDDEDVNPNNATICIGDPEDCEGTVEISGTCNVFGLDIGAGNECWTVGRILCSEDGTATYCDIGEPNSPSPELAGMASCHDGYDNDCDGAADKADTDCYPASELCNGLDDDYDNETDEDFAELGDSCEEGTGFCLREGTVVCAADHQGTECSASPGFPSHENTPGKCNDTLDNDCDGSIDIADSDCQTPEICDGLDNDGISGPDNGFDVGDTCFSGKGACEVTGLKICKADGSGTICDAVPALPSVEGPLGSTCTDGIDNDCDGLTDDADPDCVAETLDVACALIPHLGKSGKPKTGEPFEPSTDCGGKFQIQLATTGDPAHLTAELLALDVDGSLIGSLPVQDGDIAHLTSRLNPRAWKLKDTGAFVDDFAPVPMLVATYDDGQVVKQAFCAPIPYLDVLRPSGEVVSASEGDVTEVVVALPQVDPATLLIKVDGVDIVAALKVADPTIVFPGGPYGGTVMIDGQMVTVSELVVRTQPLPDFSTNSLTLKLANLGGGGHIVWVDGDPLDGALRDPSSAQCHLDNILDTGTVAVFEIEITSPVNYSVAEVTPTPVTGEVRHGRPIASARIHGLPFDVSGQIFTPGDGENSADEYVLAFTVPVPQTDMDDPPQVGTFDLGQNEVNAGAQDDLGNLTFATNHFTLFDETLAPIGKPLMSLMRPVVLSNGESDGELDLENALVLGITAAGFDTYFNSTCVRATDLVECKLGEALAEADIPTTTPDIPLACDPVLKPDIVSPEDVAFLDDGALLQCGASLYDGGINLTLSLPQIKITDATVKGNCCTGCPFCISRVTVDADADVTMPTADLGFTIDVDTVLNGGEGNEPTVPDDLGDVVISDVNCHPCDVDCLSTLLGCLIGGPIGCFVGGLIDAFDWDSSLIELGISGKTFEKDIREALNTAGDDAINLDGFNLDEDRIAQITNLATNQELVDGKIEPQGMLGWLTASIEVPDPAPGIDVWPEAPLTPAPLPAWPIDGVDDGFLVVSDDVFNLIYAGLTARGAFQVECVPTDADITFEDLMPADCDALDTALAKGRCKGAKGVDCDTLTGQPVQKTACENATQELASRNISPDTGLLVCGRQGIGPRMLLQDESSTDAVVDAKVRLNNFKVRVVLDRDGDGLLNNSLLTTLNCLGPAADDNVNSDCKWAAGCFEVDVTTTLSLDTSSGSPEIVATMGGVAGTPAAVQCEGGGNFGDTGILGDVTTNIPLDALVSSLNSLTPEFRTLGLDLGGIVAFQSQRLFTIETFVDPDCDSCQEYVGVTGQFAVPTDWEMLPCPEE